MTREGARVLCREARSAGVYFELRHELTSEHVPEFARFSADRRTWSTCTSMAQLFAWMESASEGTATWFTARNLFLRTTNMADHGLSARTKLFRENDTWGTGRRILMAQMRRPRMSTWRRGSHTWVRALYLRPTWNWGLQYGAFAMTNDLQMTSI